MTLEQTPVQTTCDSGQMVLNFKIRLKLISGHYLKAFNEMVL